jgi:hypothetical protein
MLAQLQPLHLGVFLVNITVRVNAVACLFAVAAIIKALM